jgi:hypothetical protein
MAYWLAIGPEQNVRLGVNTQMWGMNEYYRRAWENVEKDDVVILYAMKPIKGIVGYGKVLSKLEEVKPLWDEEVELDSALWRLRLRMKDLHVLPESEWNSGRLPLSALSGGITARRSFQRVRGDLAKRIIADLARRGGQKG